MGSIEAELNCENFYKELIEDFARISKFIKSGKNLIHFVVFQNDEKTSLFQNEKKLKKIE